MINKFLRKSQFFFTTGFLYKGHKKRELSPSILTRSWRWEAIQAKKVQFSRRRSTFMLSAIFGLRETIIRSFKMIDNPQVTLNNNYLNFFFKEKRNKIKAKASTLLNNVDKLISIEYSLDNFHRSNQDTCLVHKPSVFEGQWVQSGDLLADCSASVGGELALGQNILIAYMPWEGYNFEDAILVSERLVYDDLYTSVHIERYEIELRETKQGIEEITRNIPEVSESSLKHLNNFGIAKLGSWINEGDILVGKVTPINKKIQSNYQKLLYTILEKTVLPVRDSSLRAPKGIKAKVIGVQIFKHSKNNLVPELSLSKLSNLDSTGSRGDVFTKQHEAAHVVSTNNKKKTDVDFAFRKKFLNIVPSKHENIFGTKEFSKSVKPQIKKALQKNKIIGKFTTPLFPNSINWKTTQKQPLDFKTKKNHQFSNKLNILINKNEFFLKHKSEKINIFINSDLGILKNIPFKLINFYGYSYIMANNHFFSWEFKKFSFDRVLTLFHKGLILKEKQYKKKKKGSASAALLGGAVRKPSISAMQGQSLNKTILLQNKYLKPLAIQKLIKSKKSIININNLSFKNIEFLIRMNSVLPIAKNSKIKGPCKWSASNFAFWEKFYDNKTNVKTNKFLKNPKNFNNSITILNKNSKLYSSHHRLNDVSSIQIYLAEKRRLQVGDKMAGRHGNKGIISQILPIEDMPFLPDGKPLDMVLNPLGVPSRMNVGQIYECLLGLAGKYLGQHFKIFPFDEMYGAEASRSFVFSKLYDARLKTGKQWLFNQKSPGKIRLYDGRTGETFDQSITVGYAYMLRLVHMVDDKIHARSTGPYSLVTQQPLRGRSKQGGQRLGEMEVWALEGYGAAFTLLEMLTIKSDDMNGRMTLWSNLILNKEISIGTPESFKVLICELQALCLDIGLFKVE